MPSRNGRAHALTSLHALFERDSLPFVQVRAESGEPIYVSGDSDDSVYRLDSGQVKLFMSSANGEDCLIAIYTAGDVFGESCLDGSERRMESATAMLPTIVRRASRKDFLVEIERASAYEPLWRHLAARLIARQTAVFDLVTMDAERRLAKVLLELAEKVGERDGAQLRIEQRISHEELSQIVGTTRPRITAFMQRFRQLGIIDTAGTRAIRVDRQKARQFLDRD